MRNNFSHLNGKPLAEAERVEDEHEQAEAARRQKRRARRLLKQRESKPVGAAYGSSPNVKTHGL